MEREAREQTNIPRYLTDEKGERVGVVLGLSEYEALVERIEDLEDIAAYDEAKAELERGEDELIPFNQAMREIDEGRVGD